VPGGRVPILTNTGGGSGVFGRGVTNLTRMLWNSRYFVNVDMHMLCRFRYRRWSCLSVDVTCADGSGDENHGFTVVYRDVRWPALRDRGFAVKCRLERTPGAARKCGRLEVDWNADRCGATRGWVDGVGASWKYHSRSL